MLKKILLLLAKKLLGLLNNSYICYITKQVPLNKITEIFKSWGIMFNPDDQQADLASERIQICNACEHKRESPMIHCGLCGCALKAKIYSPVQGACPAGKWNEVDKILNKTNQ